MNLHPYRLMVATLVVGSLPSLLNAETYRDTANHFQLELPEGWRPLSADELSRLNKDAKNTPYDGAFRPADKFFGSASHVLYIVHRRDYSAASYEDIRKDFASGGQLAVVKEWESIEQALGTLTPGQAYLDRKRNLLFMRARSESGLGANVKSFSVGHLSSVGSVQVIGYTEDHEIAEFLPIFARINESLKIDPGYRFRPRAAAFFPADQGSRAMFAIIVVTAVVGALIGFFGYLLWRRRTSPGARVNDFARALAMSGVAFLVFVALLGSYFRSWPDSGGLSRFVCAFCVGGLLVGLLLRNRNWTWFGIGLLAFVLSILVNFGISFLMMALAPT
jgi:hypothetical protein